MTIIAVLIGSIAALTPLVKVLSQWHIALRKIAKAEAMTVARQSQTSATSSPASQPRRRGVGFVLWASTVGALFGCFVAFCGLFMLKLLASSESPLTTGRSAEIATAVTFILVGTLKDWAIREHEG